MPYAIGIGLTNECNLSCPHCYRDAGAVQRLSLADVQQIFASLPVGSINLGYAENGQHPAFAEIISWLAEQDCKLTCTSNGYSIALLPDRLLQRFTDVELSLDFPEADRQDAWRGAGNFSTVLQTVRRCSSLGVPVTILAVMMQSNYRDLVALGRLAFAEGARFRVNVYQAAKTDQFALTYEEYWDGFRRLLAEFALVATTEPVLAAALGLHTGSGCGRMTVRVMPNGSILPCTYWPVAAAHLADLPALGETVLNTAVFQESRMLPSACRTCAFVDSCGGGCAGRRALSDALGAPDPYCMLIRGEQLGMSVRHAAARDMPKSRSACTTIFAP